MDKVPQPIESRKFLIDIVIGEVAQRLHLPEVFLRDEEHVAPVLVTVACKEIRMFLTPEDDKGIGDGFTGADVAGIVF